MVIIFMLTENKGEDIFEFRNMIEKEVARLAAERITETEIKDLTKVFNKMDINNSENERSTYDGMFHYELVKSTNNIIIINIYNAMKSILKLFIKDVRKKALEEISSEEIYNDHKNIYQAVIQKNPDKALEAMVNHMNVIKKYYNEYRFNYNFEGNKVSNIVLEYLVGEIRDGNLKKGDKLPSERELQNKLNTSRNSVREIYKSLATIGILEYKSNRGTFIKNQMKDWFNEPIQIIFKLSEITEKDIFEFRKMLETEIAYLAAERITDEEIKELKRYYYLMKKSQDEIQKSKYDELFHYTINKAAKNTIIWYSYNALTSMMELFTFNIRREVEKNEPEGTVDKLHDDIFEAMINRDKEKARTYMKYHMDMIIKHFKSF
jgi:GntR family transcriptional repressor for pyruvate dehydrogenase complex